jgi:hypothetical protein
MIDVDGRDFLGKGTGSAGLQRQDCGPPDKVDNRRGGVMVSHADDRGRGLVDWRPHISAKWFNDNFSVLREERKVPEGLRHKTKNVMASVMINEMFAGGLFNGE